MSSEIRSLTSRNSTLIIILKWSVLTTLLILLGTLFDYCFGPCLIRESSTINLEHDNKNIWLEFISFSTLEDGSVQNAFDNPL